MSEPADGREDKARSPSEYTGWKPEPAPDYFELAKGVRTRRDGSIRFRNDLGRWIAHFSSLLLVTLAILDVLGSTWSTFSALVYIACSFAVHAFFGRTYVEIRGDTVVVFGPLRWVATPLASVDDVKLGFWGFPRLVTEMGSLRLWGLSLSNHDLLSGGSEDVIVLRREIERAKAGAFASNSAPANRRQSAFRAPDIFTVLLAMSWLSYALLILMS